jgi:hypothetical protein
MSSIFIWKSDVPNTSKKFIKYYSGSNWVLEDNEYSTNSFIYNEQIVIPGFNNDSVITFNIKKMPQDWVGSELLEVTSVPYELIKSDNYGILEKIGGWNRFSLKKSIEYNYDSLIAELLNIQKWISKTDNNNNNITNITNYINHNSYDKNNNQKHNIKYNHNNNSNIKYNKNTNQTHNINYNHINSNIKYNDSNKKQVKYTLDSNTILKDFENFLTKHSIPSNNR